MQLFTIQPIAVWKQLQSEKTLLAIPSLGDHVGEQTFQAAYDWMRQQMAKRIPDYQGQWPWWAWHTWNAPVRRPDLRSERHNYFRGERYALIELEVPDDKVLLSCFNGWHCVLNHWFLSYTEEEDEARNKERDAIRGNVSMTEIRKMIQKGEKLALSPEQYAKMDDYNRRCEESWEHMFDLDWMRTSPLWEGANPVQACFEELRLDQVVKITEFQGSRKKRV